MIHGVTRSKHVGKIIAAMKVAGVESITLQIKGYGDVRLTQSLFHEFLCLLRGNKLDSLVGPWISTIKEVLQVRSQRTEAGATETNKEA